MTPSRTAVQGAITAACAYEIIAIGTGRVPTISSLCRRHRTLEALFLAWLLVHLHREQKAIDPPHLWKKACDSRRYPQGQPLVPGALPGP